MVSTQTHPKSNGKTHVFQWIDDFTGQALDERSEEELESKPTTVYSVVDVVSDRHSILLHQIRYQDHYHTDRTYNLHHPAIPL